MTQAVTQVNTAADTFQVWVAKTNEMANLFSTIVVTANTDANGSLTTGNTYMNGIFGSATVAVSTLRGGNVQSSNTLTVTSNIEMTGTKFSLGNSIVNAVINSTSFTFSNSTVSLSISRPTSAQQVAGNYYLNAGGNWNEIIETQISSANTTGSSAQIVDTFAKNTYYSSEYTITVNDNNANNRQISKVLIVHDEGNAYLTEYAIVVTNNDLGAFTANINSNTVRLYFAPTSTNTTLKILKQLSSK